MADMIKSKTKVGVYYNVLKDGDKQFYFTYKDKNGNKKWTSVGKYSEGIRENIAAQKRNEQLSKMRHGEDITVVANKKKVEVITVNQLAQVYFGEKKITKERQNRYYNHIQPVFGKTNIENLTKQQVKKFLDDYSERAMPASVNAVRNILTAIINHSIKEHELGIVNPCVGIPKMKEDNNRERYLSSEDIHNLLEAVKDDYPIWLFTKLSLSTGGRARTILSIQVKDINLIDGIVNLKNHKTRETYKGYLQDDLIDFLKGYIESFRLNDYVCTLDNDGSLPTYRRVQTKLAPIIDELFNEGLASDDRKNRAVIHTLRHTFASHLAINGLPIFTIQKLMNHSKIDQTLRYAKLAPDSGKKDVKGLYR